MNDHQIVENYVAARDKFVGRIREITIKLDEWTDTHRERAPTLADVAQFEGLRAARAILLSDFTSMEDNFVVQLLERLSKEPPPKSD